MIISRDHPVWKYTVEKGNKRICKCSEVPADLLKKIREIDQHFFECNEAHLVTFED